MSRSALFAIPLTASLLACGGQTIDVGTQNVHGNSQTSPSGGAAPYTGCLLAGTVSGAPWMHRYSQGGATGAGGGSIGASLVDWSMQTTFGNDGFLYAQGTAEVDAGSRITGGPLGMSLLILPTDSPAPKKAFCATSGAFHLSNDPATPQNLSLAGLVGLPSCPGPTTVTGHVHYCLGAQCAVDFAGDLDGMSLGAMTANFSSDFAGSSTSVVLAAPDQSYVFALQGAGPASGTVRSISGLAYTSPKEGGPGTFYCIGTGTISSPATNGTPEQIDFGQFSKLGACVQDKSNSLDIACN